MQNQKVYTSYKKEIVKINNKNRTKSNEILDYDVAEDIVVDYLADKRILKMDSNEGSIGETRNLTKDELRREKEICRKMVSDCILQNNFSVRGYQSDKIDDFINEMVSEYSGYSILEDAFNDPDVDDIYCIEWDKIYIEKKGKNMKYHKTFRSKRHYKDVVERFVRKAGKEINIGDSKIVDFELYGDRGCATSPAVTPKDYTMTIRKHREDHIELDDLLYQQVLNEEISEFFGLIIDGEANLIYAGITGTGKTTTIRSLIDYYVTRNKKRMIVCEDTQEIFPKNDHTLELVTCRADDARADVSLYKLVITALRLKPKYIVVGEVRGEEAVAAVEAMETGHSTMFTMHGKEPVNIINRLVTKYLTGMPALGIDVVERIIGSAVDFIAVQDHIPEIGRKVSVITEVRFDDYTKRIILEDLLVYDFIKDDWVWKKRIDEDKCRNLLRRGVKKDRVLKWMDTGNPEEEEKALKEINETYYREKAERQVKYDAEYKERQERKAKERIRKQQGGRLLEEKMVLATEKAKQKELEDIKLKFERVSAFAAQEED